MTSAPLIRALGASLALNLTATGALAQATVGWQVAGGYPNASITARADWSSDLGAPWIFGSSAQGGSTVWSGPGLATSSAPYGLVASGLDIDYRLAPRGGPAGNTFSGGTLQISGATSLASPARSDFHLYSVLGANDPGYGIATSTRVAGYFTIDGPQPLYRFVDVHYRVDWTLASEGNALSSSELYFDGQWHTLTPGAGSFSGLFDAFDYPGTGDGRTLYPQLIAGTGASDLSLAPASGRTDLWLTVSFARTPIAAVPEPGTAPTLAVGALVLLMLARRRRAADESQPWGTQP